MFLVCLLYCKESVFYLVELSLQLQSQRCTLLETFSQFFSLLKVVFKFSSHLAVTDFPLNDLHTQLVASASLSGKVILHLS
jgi:hypothetical protein